MTEIESATDDCAYCGAPIPHNPIVCITTLKKRADELQAHIDAGIGDCFQEATDAIRKSSEAFQRRREIWQACFAQMPTEGHDGKAVEWAISRHAEFTKQMEAEMKPIDAVVVPVTSYTIDEWKAEGTRRFGPDYMDWKYICPVCKTVTAVREWFEAGVPGQAAFSCIGRTREGSRDAFGGKGDGPCTYAGGGLFRLNPVTVTYPDGTIGQAFDFAPAAHPEIGSNWESCGTASAAR